MLNRDRVIEAFRSALGELAGGAIDIKAGPTQVADRAFRIYAAGRPAEEKAPSVWTFRAYVTGRKADREIMSLITEAGVKGRARVDSDLLIRSFAFVLELKARGIASGTVSARRIAVIAHRVYCSQLPPGASPPSRFTFTQMVCGRNRRADVAALLEESGLRPRRSVRLDRERLVEAFRKAIERLEGRIAKGWVRTLHVAERAHRFYVEGAGEGDPKPSRLTFHHLVYGRTADPEIAQIVKKKLL